MQPSMHAALDHFGERRLALGREAGNLAKSPVEYRLDDAPQLWHRKKLKSLIDPLPPYLEVSSCF